MKIKVTQIKDEDRTLTKIGEMLEKGEIYYAGYVNGEYFEDLKFYRISDEDYRTVRDNILKDDKYILILIEEEN